MQVLMVRDRRQPSDPAVGVDDPMRSACTEHTEALEAAVQVVQLRM